MNKGFLFETSSPNIKSHVAQSQITLLVWPCSNHLKNNTINHMIIFNDSVSKVTSAAFKAFAEAYLFFSICLGIKKEKFVTKIFFADDVECSSYKNFWKISADVKANKTTRDKRYSDCISQIFIRSTFKTWNAVKNFA